MGNENLCVECSEFRDALGHVPHREPGNECKRCKIARAERAVLEAAKAWRRLQIMSTMQHQPGMATLDIGKARFDLEQATDALIALEGKG